jgi:hypothetical protein
MEDKIKGKENSMFEKPGLECSQHHPDGLRGRCSPLIGDPPVPHPVRLSLTLGEQLIRLHQLP